MKHPFAVLVLAMAPVLAFAQVEIPKGKDLAYGLEDRDWGVAPAAKPQGPPFGKPTPMSIPGARLIRTLELKGLLEAGNVLVVDVLDTKAARGTITGAHWLPGAGDSRFFAAEKARFAAALETISGGDKNRPIAFMCISSECWESYNAALHAVEAGYRDVLWYRGGSNAWAGAALPRRTAERINW